MNPKPQQTFLNLVNQTKIKDLDEMSNKLRTLDKIFGFEGSYVESPF